MPKVAIEIPKKETRNQSLNIRMAPRELEQINEYCYANKISRGRLIRYLLEKNKIITD